MTVRQLHLLLRGLDDTREVVVRRAPAHADLLQAVWRSAQDEVNEAYLLWLEEPGAVAYHGYRAAADRADAALDALAAHHAG
jgi:hypothetical protein